MTAPQQQLGDSDRVCEALAQAMRQAVDRRGELVKRTCAGDDALLPEARVMIKAKATEWKTKVDTLRSPTAPAALASQPAANPTSATALSGSQS